MKKTLLSLALLVGQVSGCTALNPNRYFSVRESVVMGENHGIVGADGLRMHYVHEGQRGRKKVLLLHGMSMHSGTWERTISVLSDSFDVYAPDFIGFGFSDKPLSYDYSIKQQGESISCFMNNVGIERAVVVGNSLGGGVGIYLAAKYPDKVGALVLEDSIGVRENEPFGFSLLKSPMSRFFENPKNVLNGISSLMHFPEPVSKYSAPYQMHEAWNALRETARGVPEEEVGGLIERIKVPTLIVTGRYDSIIPISASKELHSRIADSEIVVLPSGHFPHEECSERFNNVLLNFLMRRDCK